jgi:4-diphosphocytidyl-2-C-methyl-D-erythritol kinase
MIIVRSPAKINLTFNILGLRADGFHDIESIMQSISLEDEIKVSIEESAEHSFALHCDNPIIRKLIPLDESNLIAKAARAFLEKLRTEKKFKIEVHLEKKIPVGAGLAGGSSNAAAMLLALNSHFKNVFAPEELQEIAAQIGSDVPFCLKGGTCMARGRGEILEDLNCNLILHYCIVKPRKLSVSTPAAFKAFDGAAGPHKIPDVQTARQALSAGDPDKLLKGLGNVFEPIIFAQHKELAVLKSDLLKHGAWDCHMTGSGPTLFALVASREMGHHIRRQILHDDEIGFVYGTEEIILEALPPIDFRLAENCSYGAHVIS